MVKTFTDTQGIINLENTQQQQLLQLRTYALRTYAAALVYIYQVPVPGYIFYLSLCPHFTTRTVCKILSDPNAPFCFGIRNKGRLCEKIWGGRTRVRMTCTWYFFSARFLHETYVPGICAMLCTGVCVCSFVLSTRQHPAQPVSVPIRVRYRRDSSFFAS